MSEKRVIAPKALNQEGGHTLAKAVQADPPRKGETLIVDLSPTESMDSLGAAWIVELATRLAKKGASLRCEGHTGHTADFIDLLGPALQVKTHEKKRQEGLFEGIGSRALTYGAELKEFFALVVDTIYWTVIAPFEGRGFRWGLWFDEVHEMGVRAIRIVCLMNFLLGLIIAMLSAAQIAQFGLGIYVADLIMIAFARELAAIMTSVVVSARTGAAIAAEIATMKVQEEIDALRGMGLNTTQFLVAPKILALLIVLPCLVALGTVSGVLGGSLWGIIVLGFRPENWFTETLNAATMRDLFQGFAKTICFAIMIVLVGCHNGFRVKGGSRGVGLMTTRAVVMDVFFMIIIDIIFAIIFYYVLEW